MPSSSNITGSTSAAFHRSVHPTWFAAQRLSIAYFDLIEEIRMSSKIDSLTDMVNFTNSVISQASEAAGRLQVSASRVQSRVSDVNTLVAQLDKAEAALGAVMGQATNGGPSLSDPMPTVDFVQK